MIENPMYGKYSNQSVYNRKFIRIVNIDDIVVVRVSNVNEDMISKGDVVAISLRGIEVKLHSGSGCRFVKWNNVKSISGHINTSIDRKEKSCKK
jgi:hypothetical protein